MKESYHVSTIQKAVDILNFFKEYDKLSFSRLQELSGYNKSTLYRILYTLEYNDYLRKDKHRRYELGINIFILGNRITSSNQLIKYSQPLLDKLSKSLGFTIHLGTLNKDEVIIIKKIQPSNSIQMVSRPGSSVPPHCTGQGKTLLAFSPREKVEEIIELHGLKKYTETTITDKDELFADLAEIRKRGYTIDDSEHEKNIRCVAVPILDNDGKIKAALSASGLITDFPSGEKELKNIADILMEARDTICKKIGYR